MKISLRFCLKLAGVAIALLVLVPAGFLTIVWWQDSPKPIAADAAGTNDASHLNAVSPGQVIPVAHDPKEAEEQLRMLVRKASSEHRHIAISGAHHSMGGHTLYPGQLVLDMLSFNTMVLDAENRVLTVGSGARWSEIIPYLDHRGLAVAVMQSNNDFSVGGSISVNCHGWQNDSQPIASTVISFRIMTADGNVRTCSRTENQELFSLALGGYGLFGIILDVKLRVVENEYYKAEAYPTTPADYHQLYHTLTTEKKDIGLAYGRINVAPSSFLEHGIVTILRRQSTDRSTSDTVQEEKPNLLKRVVFRGGAGSSFGKNLRWTLENLFGETGGVLLARNQIMHEPAYLYANRDPLRTDILHEYFIPVDRLGEFIDKARPVFLKHHADLLNITVRNVEPDRDTFLRYAREEVFGLVMLFNQARNESGEKAMQELTRELVDTALACGGTYYLPYRAHPTREQFLRAYPQAPEFFAKKREYDPEGLFENQFYLNFGPNAPK